jgi:uncharacterized membrane-anchored protein YhcB (DUF1043 family)
MEIRLLDFTIGLVVGIILGLGMFWLGSRLRNWVGRSEMGRLTTEIRQLKRRLDEKDRRVSRMMTEAERLAEKLAQGKGLVRGKTEDESKEKKALPGSFPT